MDALVCFRYGVGLGARDIIGDFTDIDSGTRHIQKRFVTTSLPLGVKSVPWSEIGPQGRLYLCTNVCTCMYVVCTSKGF
jgi:hypothetical protein